LYNIIHEKNHNTDSYTYDILIGAGEFTEEEITKLKCDYFELPYTDMSQFCEIDTIDYRNFEPLIAIPFSYSKSNVHVAIYDPHNLEAKDKVKYILSINDKTEKLEPIYYIASKSNIMLKFREINQCNTNTINTIILDACNKLVSDIHIIPFEKTCKILFRIDGILTEYKIVNIDKFNQLVISLKVLAKLDISENRRPQSGHFQKDNIDFRISTHPTQYGESTVIRILNKRKSLISIENLGFSVDQIQYLKKVSSFSNGMIIFCGPTGSGKTTSIYSIIETMDKKSRNVITLEDPIEYQITNIRQTEIKSGIIDFVGGIKSILRQDPDVILIGEIRDEETAKIAIRASMTGHLVLTTIHANDSFGAIARLQEFKIQNSLIADNIITIISQRLIKNLSKPGRTIVSEILKFDETIKNVVCSCCCKQQIIEYATSKLGFISIFDDCLNKIRNGLISHDSVSKILGIDVN
jgi:type II secretory ATPase GspE/PulE/Tfp pilus assembly ATPase PilB-like protein